MTYDTWKSTNPADAEYCPCGWHMSECIMDEFGVCIGDDPELEPVASEESHRMAWRWEEDTTETVKADADARCFICRSSGWHWGWNEAHEAVMLRCPCVERNRAFPHMRDTGPLRLTDKEHR
jgi:hypothetical protein